MKTEDLTPPQILIQRIFRVQVALVVSTTLLFVLAENGPRNPVNDTPDQNHSNVENVEPQQDRLGFFWFAFIAGSFGASVSTLRRLNAQPEDVKSTIIQSWSLTLSPLLYGAMLAGIAYFLFVSGILSGVSGEGLFKTNLFPDFTYPKGDHPASLAEFRKCTPTTTADAGKLLVWCFIAGYSEKFITNILGRLEETSTGQGSLSDSKTKS